MQPYSPRAIRFHGVRRHDSWKLKLYSVLYGTGPFDWGGFEPGLQAASSALPQPDASRGRPGLGFLIAHQGRTGDYVVLGWWDRENEIPLHVWVRNSRSAAWQPGADDESICVWDLEILWAERQAWVTTMMATSEANAAAYLECVEPRFRRDEAAGGAH